MRINQRSHCADRKLSLDVAGCCHPAHAVASYELSPGKEATPNSENKPLKRSLPCHNHHTRLAPPPEGFGVLPAGQKISFQIRNLRPATSRSVLRRRTLNSQQ